MYLEAYLVVASRSCIPKRERRMNDDAQSSTNALGVVDFGTRTVVQHAPGVCLSASSYLRASVALAGGIIWWIGSWNALEVYLLPDNPWLDVLCIIVGVSVLLLTRTFKLQAGILPSSYGSAASPAHEEDIRLDSWRAIGMSIVHWLGHYLRSFAALCGSVIMWKGGYKLLDSYFLPTTLLRDILYMVLGLLLLTLTDTLSGNAGLSPLSFIIRSSFPDQPSKAENFEQIQMEDLSIGADEDRMHEHDEDEGREELHDVHHNDVETNGDDLETVDLQKQ